MASVLLPSVCCVCRCSRILQTPSQLLHQIRSNFHSQQNKLKTKRSLIPCFAVGYAFGLGLSYLWHRHTRSSQDLDTERPKFGKKRLMKIEDYWIPELLLRNGNLLETIANLQLGKNDIVVSSFPKSGTTWIQEIVYLISNNVDIVDARSKVMEERFPYLEYPYPGIADIISRSEPRLIKTHLPYGFLPKCLHKNSGKIIYIARNPKDVSVSYYHFTRMFTELSFDGSFQEFFEEFTTGRVPYGPWWQHVGEFWEHSVDDNVLFVTYEDLQENAGKVIRSIAEFLGKDLSSTEVEKISLACSFKVMKSNPSSNYSWWNVLGLRRKNESEFFRKGIVGDWKNYYSTDMNSKMDTLVKNNVSEKGLDFRYEQ